MANAIQFLQKPKIRQRLMAWHKWRLYYSGCGVPAAKKIPVSFHRWLAANQHCHACLDIMLALQGNTWYSIDGAVYACQPGALFVFYPHRPHQCGYPLLEHKGDKFAHLWICVAGDMANAQLILGRHGQAAFQRIPWTSATLEQCRLSWPLTLPADHIPSDEKELKLFSIVAALLAGLLEGAHNGQADLLDRRKLAAQKINALRRHLKASGGRNANLTHLAHMAGYSKYHLSRLFKEITGQTIHSHVNQCRWEKALALQKQGLSMKEIADQLGFGSLSAFVHWRSRFRTAIAHGRR